jgi:choice-of-anchor B domain-containing protein
MKIPSLVLASLGLATLVQAQKLESLAPRVPRPAPRIAGGPGVVNFTASNIVLMGWLPLADLDPASVSGSNCWGYTAPSGREYAIIGVNTGTAFVEITDPGKPDLVYFHPGIDSLWRELKAIAAGYAYVVTEGDFVNGDGIQVFDLRQIDSGVVTWVRNVTTGGCTTGTHTISVNEATGYLYRNGGGSGPCSGGGNQGLLIYSLTNPGNPSFVTAWNNLYVHDSTPVVWNRTGPLQGRELVFCNTETSSGGGSPSITILDVTNKAAITTVKTLTYPSSSFSHQCWLSADQRYAYLDDETDGLALTRVFDVGTPSSATFVGTFSSGSTAIDHNLYVKNNRIYEANYRSGLRIFDNTNPTSPTQVAWFDTYPADDDADFNGLWGNYPFFPSGTVIGSDLESGLFIWYIGAPKLTFTFPGGTPQYVAPGGGGKIAFDVLETTPGVLLGNTVAFHLDAGSGFTTLPAVPAGGNRYVATLPTIPCGTSVKFYVSAKTTDGRTWTDPQAGPTQFHSAFAALAEKVTYNYTAETAGNWVGGQPGDTATTGIWTRVNPIGTAAQPEDDHTPDPAVFCWVTGQGTPGGSSGENDVDNGKTTLLSAQLNATGLTDPYISYWRWYSNNQGTPDDPFVIDISNNGGTSWVNLETIPPTGPNSIGGWIQHRARIKSFLTPTNNMRVRFIAQDIGSGSIVEAAVDDVQISDLVCTIGISTISPAQGRFRGGNTVTIVGEGFVEGLTSVSFDGREALGVSVLSPTTLEAVVPPAPRQMSGKLGMVVLRADVRVTTGPGSATLANGYTYELSEEVP